MVVEDVQAVVQDALASFSYSALEGPTVGVPWSQERVAVELDALRGALVEPYVASVHVADTAGPSEVASVRQLWVVTRAVENGYLVVFDPESREFGLAVSDGHRQDTVGVWGDLVSTFMAR